MHGGLLFAVDPTALAGADPVAIVALLLGTVTTLGGIIAFLFRLHLQADDRERAAGAKREEDLAAQLHDTVRERDLWRDRSIQTDRRLDSVAGVLTTAGPDA